MGDKKHRAAKRWCNTRPDNECREYPHHCRTDKSALLPCLITGTAKPALPRCGQTYLVIAKEGEGKGYEHCCKYCQYPRVLHGCLNIGSHQSGNHTDHGIGQCHGNHIDKGGKEGFGNPRLLAA